MTLLSTLLQKKFKTKGLGIAQSAKAVGISFPTMRSALLGLRVPNARCVGKFAKFLGISASAVVTAAGPKGRRGKSGASRPATRAVGAVPGGSNRANAAIIQKLTKLLSKATSQLNALSHPAAVIPGKRRTKRVVPKPKAKLPVRGVFRIKARPPAVKVKPKRMSRKPSTKKATPPTLPKSVPVKKSMVKAKPAKKRRQQKPVTSKVALPIPPTSAITPEIIPAETNPEINSP